MLKNQLVQNDRMVFLTFIQMGFLVIFSNETNHVFY